MERNVKRLLEPAQKLDSVGFRVVPTLIREKVPALWEVGEDAGWKRWQTEETGPHLERWFASANARIGLGTLTGTPGGWVCLDIDSPGGYDFWCEQLGGPPATAHVRTQSYGEKGGGGVGHYWYRLGATPVHSCAATKEQAAAGVRWDLKGTGGYAVLPPTTGYTWVKSPLEALTAPVDLQKPETVQKEAYGGRRAAPDRTGGDAERYAAAVLRSECAELKVMGDGDGRNNRLNRGAFKLGRYVRDGLLDAEDVIACLLDSALECGLDDDAARKTIASGLTAGVRECGMRSA